MRWILAAATLSGSWRPSDNKRVFCSQFQSCKRVKTLIYGAGNLLLSDEGFGVHFVRWLQRSYVFPPEIELLDAGTLGILTAHVLEDADQVYLVDILALPGEPGHCFRYRKEDFIAQRLLIKLSPHQIGVQEMLLLSEMRGRCPSEVTLLGLIPVSLEPGDQLSLIVEQRMVQLASELVAELRTAGHNIRDYHHKTQGSGGCRCWAEC
jgi:hydrogenase maturation protease